MLKKISKKNQKKTFFKFFFEKISKKKIFQIFFKFFFGKFKKNKIKISDVFGFFILCVVFEIFKVKKMDNVRLTPPFGSLCPLNMSDEQGAYALTVNLASDIFYHRAHGGCPY